MAGNASSSPEVSVHIDMTNALVKEPQSRTPTPTKAPNFISSNGRQARQVCYETLNITIVMDDSSGST